ncbi:MAG: ribonuclease Y, partial [Candidatus Dadabacteria bacterium]|nr:ribonuclease Y [Candidatus Dadabacteria bacterium]
MQAQSILLFLLLFGLGFAAHFFYRMIMEKNGISKSEEKARSIVEGAQKKAEEIKNRAENRAKKIVKDRNSQMQKMSSEKRREFSATEKKLKGKEEEINRKHEEIEKKESELEKIEADLENKGLACEAKQKTLDENIEDIKGKIEEVSGLTREAAKAELVSIVEDEARHEAAKRLKHIEEECNSSAEQKAKNIISLAIQRYSGSYTSEKTVSVVNLPSDDVKGRIIGREGRNIRSIELRTGVDIIIDDTPETVVISCFNPIRREVAKISLERLIADGRIHPARIEEVVTEVEKEVEKEIQKEGEKALFDLGIGGMHPELIQKLGMLKYRTSYSQNILNHSIEVGFICGILAAEVGYNEKLAKRAGLLHDIGKAVDHEV